MAKIDEFLNYLRDNPNSAVTVEEIIDKWNVSYNTAYSWMRNRYIKEERMGARPKRVKFNFTKYNKEHEYDGNYVPTGKSVDKAFSKDAEALSGELRAAHTNCIKFPIPSDEIAAKLIESISTGKLNINLKDEFDNLKEDIGNVERAMKFKSVLLSTHRVIEYLEKKNFLEKKNGN